MSLVQDLACSLSELSPPRRSDNLFSLAINTAGPSRRDTSRILVIQSQCEGFGKDGVWYWSLPNPAAEPGGSSSYHGAIDTHEVHRSSPLQNEYLWGGVSIYGEDAAPWRCSSCRALERNARAEGGWRCAGCGAHTDGTGRVLCLACGGPAEDNQRLRCMACIRRSGGAA
jgi:hypothetical protein